MKRHLVPALALLTVVLFLAACGREQPPAPADTEALPPAPPAPPGAERDVPAEPTLDEPLPGTSARGQVSDYGNTLELSTALAFWLSRSNELHVELYATPLDAPQRQPGTGWAGLRRELQGAGPPDGGDWPEATPYATLILRFAEGRPVSVVENVMSARIALHNFRPGDRATSSVSYIEDPRAFFSRYEATGTGVGSAVRFTAARTPEPGRGPSLDVVVNTRVIETR